MVATSQQPPDDPVGSTAERFAFGLRALRSAADGPTYRQMAARTGQSPSALSHAAKGGQLPSLEVALAYVEACGGDRTEWEQRWLAAQAELDTAPPPPQRRRWPFVAAAGTLALALVVAGAVLVNRRGQDPPAPDTAAGSPRFFAADDAFNRRHPRPRLAPDSARMVADLLAPGRVELYTGTAGSLVYRATSGTPAYEVTPRKHVGQWGPNPFEGVDLPWDASWKAPAAGREWAVVIRPDGRAVECWRAEVRDGRPSCEWGAVSDIRGSSVPVTGQETGSGLSRLAGMITRAEWKAGRIDHALSFGTPDNNGRHVFPAVGSDGKGEGRWRLGQFIWLDRSYDIDAETSLKPYERMVAKALQEYGAFNVKNAGEFSFTSEYGSTAPGSGDAGYAPLGHIKFAKYLRVGTIAPTP
ncbi:helix-turn-helix domain-containing protein [Streptomyces sp. BE147]|uniref:helix-turn-helix domain-containing protein n=1 Tax=Streptomyces sp. BE147 TaxID=3002524 RepID=UPI002E7A50C5|nr:helix-turn-helix transcriptional regulator [Streptomyces sp. BE147]